METSTLNKPVGPNPWFPETITSNAYLNTISKLGFNQRAVCQPP